CHRDRPADSPEPFSPVDAEVDASCILTPPVCSITPPIAKRQGRLVSGPGAGCFEWDGDWPADQARCLDRFGQTAARLGLWFPVAELDGLSDPVAVAGTSWTALLAMRRRGMRPPATPPIAAAPKPNTTDQNAT